ncbi:MAG: replication-associated recombination protein A [Alicyclobacillus sp.]|nr:replication-associated recombination protein A [Alicyclobacillus sp.]
MRPRTLDELVGQEEVIGPGSALRRAAQTGQLRSVILYGPPGTGKTALANVLAAAVQARFVQLNAVTAGVAELRQVIQQARDERALYNRQTVLFIDEIHRFNKAQQDLLLPHVEQGLLTLVGATTENPSFAVNAALLSRSQVYRLQPLSAAAIRQLLERALRDPERGLGAWQAVVENAALDWLAQAAAGDARRALNALEWAVTTAPLGPDGRAQVDLQQMRTCLQQRTVLYDSAGDEHYDTISAWIKAVRGSDPDAAVLWLAKMLTAGEDPLFIARRLVILAAEDIGLADPQALPLAVATLHAVQAIGMPEARIPLAEATIYLARANKSNAAYQAINAAMRDVEQGLPLTVPAHLRGTGYAGAAALGSGVGYLYPHDYPGHWVEQNYWPVGVAPRRYVPREDGQA